ncbi:HAD family hydrolase [Mesorhizobium sp. ZC-5]|uniref:HAD family hydrolase n=1 Tax=Mesorhizobium sp. ZC-5 TaxID=2986066 RepID=UPI0021E98DD5|nr:HAD family phosphatase [Mesorhizobium sp. ZC-5]MCV3239569.1 HAD family phosphatase [Mesorhizobium sp. ZC-5]
MKLIIFDCDGVLVNSEEIYIAAELEFLAEIGAVFEQATYMQSFMGLSPSMWREKLRPAVEQNLGKTLPADFFDRMQTSAASRIETDLAALPDAYGTIGKIGALRCVASSTPSVRLHWKLQRAGLIDLFAPHIFSSDMVKNGKPAPDLFLHAAATMGIEPADCLVVEDSANGVLAGKAAGMKVVGLTAGRHCLAGHANILSDCGADVIVESYATLPAALAAFEKPTV